MSLPVFVAGVGIISAIGNDKAACLDALESGRAGMGDIAHLDTIHAGKIPVAEVKLNNDQLSSIAGLSPRLFRTALISTIAAKEAIGDAGIADFPSLRTGFISANTVGGMDKSERFLNRFFSDRSRGRLRDII